MYSSARPRGLGGPQEQPSTNSRNRALAAAVFVLILFHPATAHAFIPSTLGPLQALLTILPQLLLALGAAFLALFRPRTYRFLFSYLWAHKGLSLALIGIVVLIAWGPGRLFGGKVSQETAGSAWTAFRGGAERCGAVPAARGPVAQPQLRWKFTGDNPITAIDSSAAAVGNRLYFGVNIPSVFSPAGALYGVDAETGRAVWKYTGQGDLEPALRPVFSSPAVWDSRFLVCGEGYHVDRDCRIVCLDLEPVRRGEKPKLHWAVATTSHVESSPCVHDGKAYVGAGDDGVWCIDVASGRVIWHLEGGRFYEAARPDMLASRVGQTVTAVGTAKRIRASEEDDVGKMVLDIRAFDEPPRAGERAVAGRVVKHESTYRLEPAEFCPDAESSPAAAGGSVVFGSGIDGRAVVCVRADTGARIWKTPVPFPAFGSPTLAGDRVLIGLGNGNFVTSDANPVGLIVCLSLQDGKELWRFSAADTILGAIPVFEGRAYACSRDGNVYVLDAASGKLSNKFTVGTPLVCSPAVTADALYLTTTTGKTLCLDRDHLKLQWSLSLTPGSPIMSSPVVAGGALFAGTARGMFALEGSVERHDAPRAPRPWSGPGGGADRSGVADEAGLYSAEGDLVDRKWQAQAPLDRPVTGPVIACGRRVYAVQDERLTCVDAESGRSVWQVRPGPVREMVADESQIYARLDNQALVALRSDTGAEAWRVQATGPHVALAPGILLAGLEPGVVHALDPRTGSTIWKARTGELAGAPAIANNLIVLAAKDRLICLSDVNGETLWTSSQPCRGAPTILGGRVFVATSRALICRKLTDGSAAWRQELDEEAASTLVAGGDTLAFSTRSGNTIVARASDGKLLEVLPVGRGATAPALVRDLLIVAGENRVGAYDVTSSEWRWSFRDEESIGAVVAPPVVARDTLWVGTSKTGLVPIRPGEPVKIKK